MAGKINPQWISGPVAVAPAANTILVSPSIAQGRLAFIYGLRINSQEVNAAGKVWQFGLGSGIGAPTIVLYELDVLNPIIDSNVPLWVTFITPRTGFQITNLLAGTAATRHQAWIKYAEMDLADIEGIVLGG